MRLSDQSSCLSYGLTLITLVTCFVDDFMGRYMQALTFGKPIVGFGGLNSNLLTSSYESRGLKYLYHGLNMGQLITEPTRVTPASQSLIDVCRSRN